AFDELDDDAIDYIETEDAQDVGRTRYDYVDALGRFKSVLAWDFKRH
ncbi:hypothetical protein Tco_1222451, partial [Tanacetum coccineum]